MDCNFGDNDSLLINASLFSCTEFVQWSVSAKLDETVNISGVVVLPVGTYQRSLLDNKMEFNSASDKLAILAVSSVPAVPSRTSLPPGTKSTSAMCPGPTWSDYGPELNW